MSYTIQEVQKHRSKESLWVVHDSKVYDVTSFAQKHPGGQDVLLKRGGQSVNNVMQDVQSHRHTKSAYRILDKYVIGDLEAAPGHKKKTKNKKACKKSETVTKPIEESSKSSSGTLSDWREDENINWDEPIVWQVGKLGQKYMEWVHSPVDKRIRFFHSDICEYLSTCSWWVVPVVWIPVMAVYMYCSLTNFLEIGQEVWLPGFFGGVSVNIWWSPFLFAVGALMWSFIEYVVHRWFFHLEPPPDSELLITLHFIIHGQHHKAPMDKDRLVFPPVPATVFAITIIFLYTSLFPKAMAQSMLAGTALGYVFYDLVHYYLHHGSPSLLYFKNLKNYHVKHHYVHQKKGFGISSKFWDYPFGTVIPEHDRHED